MVNRVGYRAAPDVEKMDGAILVSGKLISTEGVLSAGRQDWMCCCCCEGTRVIVKYGGKDKREEKFDFSDTADSVIDLVMQSLKPRNEPEVEGQ